jgi:hypothetical protein
MDDSALKWNTSIIESPDWPMDGNDVTSHRRIRMRSNRSCSTEISGKNIGRIFVIAPILLLGLNQKNHRNRLSEALTFARGVSGGRCVQSSHCKVKQYEDL